MFPLISRKFPFKRRSSNYSLRGRRWKGRGRGKFRPRGRKERKYLVESRVSWGQGEKTPCYAWPIKFFGYNFVAGSSRSILDRKKDTPFRFWAIVAGTPVNRKQASFLHRSTDHITFMIRKKKYNFPFQNLSNHSLIQSNHGGWYYYWINHTRPT